MYTQQGNLKWAIKLKCMFLLCWRQLEHLHTPLPFYCFLAVYKLKKYLHFNQHENKMHNTRNQLTFSYCINERPRAESMCKGWLHVSNLFKLNKCFRVYKRQVQDTLGFLYIFLWITCEYHVCLHQQRHSVPSTCHLLCFGTLQMSSCCFSREPKV